MEKLFVIGNIAGVAIVLIGAIILVLEIYGKSIFLTAPFIR
jgi:hypothetical protein